MEIKPNTAKPPLAAMPKKQPRQVDDGAETHLIVRTLTRDSFRRAGLTFTRKWYALERALLGEEREKLLEREAEIGMLEVRRCSELEAKEAGDEPDARGLYEMRQALKAAEKRAELAETELADLKSKIRDGHFAEPVRNPKTTGFA